MEISLIFFTILRKSMEPKLFNLCNNFWFSTQKEKSK